MKLKPMDKFYIKLTLYMLIIGFTSYHSWSNFNMLHEHLFFELFNPIMYTKYLLNFLVGLIMVILQFEILKTDKEFLGYCDYYLRL